MNEIIQIWQAIGYFYNNQILILQDFLNQPLWLVNLLIALLPLSLALGFYTLQQNIRREKTLKLRKKRTVRRKFKKHRFEKIQLADIEKSVSPVQPIIVAPVIINTEAPKHETKPSFDKVFDESDELLVVDPDEASNIHKILKRLRKQYKKNYFWQKLELRHKDNQQLDYFLHKSENVLKRQEELLEKLVPMFISDPGSGKFQKLGQQELEISLLEDLLKLWQQGYRIAELAPLLIFYLWNKQEDCYTKTKMILEIMSFRDIGQKERELLQFYFQDLLGLSIAPEALPLEIGLSMYANSKFCFSMDAYQFLQKGNSIKSFKAMHKMFTGISLHSHEWLDFLQFYKNLLLAKSSRILVIFLFKHYPDIFHEEYRSLLIRLTFQYGRYDRLRLLESFATEPLFCMLENPLKADSKQTDFSQVLFFINSQLNSDIHLFYFLLRQNMQSSLLKSLKVENAEDYYRQIFSKSRQKTSDTPTNKPNLFIRYIIFLYFAYHRQWNKIIPLYNTLGKYKREMLCGFFHGRALFATGQMQQAHKRLLDLLADYPDNLYVLNEAAIYSFHMDDMDTASQIFSTMKQLYPNEAATKYNEAVFFEYQAQQAIEKKWQEIGNLTA